MTILYQIISLMLNANLFITKVQEGAGGDMTNFENII